MTNTLRRANLLRFYLEKFLYAFLLVVCLPGFAFGWAQDDPFGQPGAAAEASNAAQAVEKPQFDPSLPDSAQLIIRAVEDSNPRTEIELVTAVRTLLDINQFDHARYYLSVLQAAQMDDAKLFEVFESLGADFFLVLHASEEMQPAGQAFAKRVLTAAAKQARSPARLSELIKALSNDDISVRSAAFRKLRRLGSTAVAEMIHVFAQADRQKEFSFIRAALKSMGNDALPPLLAAARANDLQVQAEAVHALGSYRSADATDVMMRTYLSPKLPESLRRVALDSLMTSERLPADPGYVEDRLYHRAQEYLMGRRKVLGGMTGQVTLWYWDAKAKRLASTTVSSETASRIAAAERAADLYEIQPTSTRNREMYLLTQLEAAKRIAGPTRQIDIAVLQKRFPDAQADEFEAILEQAIKLELIPAATACCEMLGEIGSASLLTGSGNQPRALVRAMLVGDRNLQFAAFEAINLLDPQQAYAGSSYQLLLAVYLASSDSQADGLIGHIRSDIAQSYAASLQIAGLVGRPVVSSREFFREAIRNPDLEVLVIADTLDRPDYAELIQQLRNDLRTKRLPIALLVRDGENSLRVQRLVGHDPFFVSLPLSMEPSNVATHVSRLRGLSQPWSVSDLSRRRHANAAIQWLAKVAQDRERYGFYDLGGYQEQLMGLLYLPGYADSASQILVNLGTPAAQRELINFVNQSGLPIEEREKIASAFSQSIQKGGTLLTQDEILRQYERYNASETEPEATQKVLGSILDAIESRVREN